MQILQKKLKYNKDKPTLANFDLPQPKLLSKPKHDDSLRMMNLL